MSGSEVLATHVTELQSALAAAGEMATAFEATVERLAVVLRAGGRVLVAGNGGSAAQAQHLAAELVGRLSATRDRPPLAAIALGADSATVTAVANDYGFEEVFARQVGALGTAADALVVLSTSGGSANLVRAVTEARNRGMTTVALVGATPRALHVSCDVVLAAPSSAVGVVQEIHLLLVHALVEAVEDRLSSAGDRPAPPP